MVATICKIEYVATGHGMPSEQVEQPINSVRWDGQHMEKGKQAGNRGRRLGSRARIGNAARIGHNGIRFAEYLRGDKRVADASSRAASSKARAAVCCGASTSSA